MPENSLQLTINKMQMEPLDHEGGYYCFSLTADELGEIAIGAQTRWVGFLDEEHRIELRKPSLVKPILAEKLRSIGQECYFVSAPEHMTIFLMLGGHALIVPTIVESMVPEWLEASPCYPTGSSGFAHFNPSISTALRRAPTPKLRMEVLKRDGRRCRICGRSPDDDVHVRLEVHHVRPWGERGVTTIENLITLCLTCHSGLDPHYDYSLYSYLEKRNAESAANEHDIGVGRFREAAAKFLDSKPTD